MKEIIVLSGKGGTGKTTVLGSIACLTENKVLADCDVDAADLHLLLDPKPRSENEFLSGVKARVEEDLCNSCGTCVELCEFDAIEMNDKASVQPLGCEGCGVCAYFCPEHAIMLDKNHCGTWYVSDTDYGTLVHAQLFAGEENSGKLVSFVKSVARDIAKDTNADLILVDGSPGIGCPVIACISGADAVIAVTEPSLSGWHDLERVLDLAVHFQVPVYVCLNKWDLYAEMADTITDNCRKRGVEVLGRIPFDPAVIDAQLQGVPVVLHESPATTAIKSFWAKLEEEMENPAAAGKQGSLVSFPNHSSR